MCNDNNFKTCCMEVKNEIGKVFKFYNSEKIKQKTCQIQNAFELC